MVIAPVPATGRGGESGYTLIELLAVVTILTTVLGTLTGLFVSGTKAELDLNRRFEAQQSARVALDRLRRELHCANAITPTTPTTVSSIVVTVPGHCPGTGGSTLTVTYATAANGTSRWKLTRKVGTGTAVAVADYLTASAVFTYYKPQPDTNSTAKDGTLGRLHVELPVNVRPTEGWKQWRLVDDIVLRNTFRQ